MAMKRMSFLVVGNTWFIDPSKECDYDRAKRKAANNVFRFCHTLFFTPRNPWLNAKRIHKYSLLLFAFSSTTYLAFPFSMKFSPSQTEKLCIDSPTPPTPQNYIPNFSLVCVIRPMSHYFYSLPMLYRNRASSMSSATSE